MSHVSTVLPDRALIRISGTDASDWLQGLVTQTVPAFGSATQVHSAFLTPQGRVLGEMVIVATDDALVLDVDTTFRDSLIPRLTLYKLRAKVEISPMDGVVTVGWGGPPPAGAFVDPRLPALGWRALSPVDGPDGADPSDYARHRRALGVAEIAADRLVDRIYAVEANLDLLNGVDFHKGCFIGQETTSRMYRRGGAKNRILPFTGPADTNAGDEILLGELRAGEVIACTEGRGLALMRLDRSEGALSVRGAPLILSPPQWMAATWPNSGQVHGTE